MIVTMNTSSAVENSTVLQGITTTISDVPYTVLTLNRTAVIGIIAGIGGGKYCYASGKFINSKS